MMTIDDLDPADPRRIAFEAYMKTAEFKEILAWAIHAGFTENGMLHAFLAGHAQAQP